MQKMLVSDYDNTFYISEDLIDENIKSVNKFLNKKNMFIIATGRSYQDLLEKTNKYKIPFNYAILNHGATIIDDHGKVLFNCYIKDKVKNKIINNIDFKNVNKYFCCSCLNSRVNHLDSKLTKIYIKYNNRESLDKMISYLNLYFNFEVNYYNVSLNTLEIVSKESSKYNGVKWLAKFLNISDEYIYTIGDSYSDIEMIRKFNGARMHASVDELKNINVNSYKSVSDFIKEIN